MALINRYNLRNISRWLYKALFDVTVEGQENIPLTGGCILATNHMSRLDTPLLLNIIPRDDLAALVTDKYRFNPLFALFVITTGSVWINREIADFPAIRAGLAIIRKGGILGIAPEGTRSKRSQLLEAKNGTAMIAEKANVPVITVSIYGIETAMSDLLHFRKTKIYAIFGKPFQLPPVGRDNRESDLTRNTEEIMCRIAANLPEKYRGFYRDHSRTQELLKYPDSKI